MSRLTTTINIGGKERPIEFNLSALSHFEELSGINVIQVITSGDIVSLVSFSKLPKLTFCALVAGANATRERVRFTLDDVYQWLEEDYLALSQQVGEALSKSTFLQNFGEDEEEEAEAGKSKKSS